MVIPCTDPSRDAVVVVEHNGVEYLKNGESTGQIIAVLGVDGISEVPGSTALAGVPVGVVQTVHADSAEAIASVVVGHVDVPVAHAGLAEISWERQNYVE